MLAPVFINIIEEQTHPNGKKTMKTVTRRARSYQAKAFHEFINNHPLQNNKPRITIDTYNNFDLGYIEGVDGYVKFDLGYNYQMYEDSPHDKPPLVDLIRNNNTPNSVMSTDEAYLNKLAAFANRLGDGIGGRKSNRRKSIRRKSNRRKSNRRKSIKRKSIRRKSK
jgi:hypothetical protein